MAKVVSTLDVFHALSTAIAQYKGIARIVKTHLSDLELIRDCLSTEIDENKSLQEQLKKEREALKKEREAHKKDNELAAHNFDQLLKERDELVALLTLHQKQSEQSKPNPFGTHRSPYDAIRNTSKRSDTCIKEQPRNRDEKLSMSAEVGAKYDGGKLRYSLLPKGTITEVLKVLEFGAKKYAPDNWMKVDNAQIRYYDAALRHITAWHEGEEFDQETGVSHIAHALCCLHFLMWFELEKHNG